MNIVKFEVNQRWQILYMYVRQLVGNSVTVAIYLASKTFQYQSQPENSVKYQENRQQFFFYKRLILALFRTYTTPYTFTNDN